MSAATSPRWRALRAWVFALVTGLLTAGGHVMGGGEFPDLPVLLTVIGLVGVAATGLARRRCGYPTIAGLLAAGQLAFHLLFTITEHAGHPLDLPRMALFHLVATALTAVVLSGGERALFVLLSAVRRWVSLPVAPAPVDLGPGWTARLALAITGEPQAGMLAVSPHRGPPSGFVPLPMRAA